MRGMRIRVEMLLIRLILGRKEKLGSGLATEAEERTTDRKS